MEKINKMFFTILLFLFIFMSASCVCASEIHDNNATLGCDNVNSNLLGSVTFPVDWDVDDDYEHPVGTFNELNADLNKLRPDDHYILKKDFKFSETDKSHPIINITSDYVAIYGKNHVIDACGCDLAKVIVTGKHVSLYDVQFINFRQSDIHTDNYNGNICWEGDSGLIYGCTFNNNTASNGGALTWCGNNGKIQNCIFDNNTALNKGGAIYMMGENNYIKSSTFITFKSALANEAVYYAKSSKTTSNSLNIADSFFDNTKVKDVLTKVLWDCGCRVIYDSIDLSYGDFNELCNDLENLNSGDYYNVENDYCVFNPKETIAKNRIINISADNVTINGNGHILDGRGSNAYFALFNVTGKNVSITNFVIRNFKAYDSDYVNSRLNRYGNDYNHLISPIEWHGNNGYLFNCTFNDNDALKGGAINWHANNGIIEDCNFTSNAADFGGSIYINGCDNEIRNCKFTDSYATNHYEAIYFTGNKINNPKLTLSNCLFESKYYSAKDVDVVNGCEVIYKGSKPKNVFPTRDISALYNDLINLKDGDVYSIDNNYNLNMFFKSIDINADNVIINGNGYTISGKYPTCSLFNVNGKNVKIENLNLNFTNDLTCHGSLIVWNANKGILSNCNFTGSRSVIGGALLWRGNNGIVLDCSFNECMADIDGGAICWRGNNGMISNCSFNECNAPVGGAISWSGYYGVLYSSTFNKNSANCGGSIRWNGDGGSISDCIFIDNEAECVGGAIYIESANNNIFNSIFINSPSKVLGEAIYMNCNRVNITLKNNAYKNNVLYIDGAKSKIDIDDILSYSCYSQVADEKVNLAALILKILTKNEISYLNNGVMYYGDYNDKEFTLHVTKFFNDISFTKNYKFNNLSSFNDIFKKLKEMDYGTSITVIQSITIFSCARINDDYNSAILSNAENLEGLGKYLVEIPDAHDDGVLILNKIGRAIEGIPYNKNITLGLNINFAGAYVVRGDYMLKMDNLGFDVINIDGNGTKIYIESKDSTSNKWACVGTDKLLSVSNMIIEGYNTAIENLNLKGQCILENVIFNNNRMNYWFDKDYGAAIQNTQFVECINCTFSNNYAKYGGAIYCEGFVNLTDCKFKNNTAYGKGPNVCLGSCGVAIVDGKVILGGSPIVDCCDKELKENSMADYIYRVFPYLKEDNEYHEKEQDSDSGFHFLPNEENCEVLNIIKRIFLPKI